ncbi:MAG: protein tyrosine phosphatase [Salinarimonas sp.]|nr:protein tyrosine phosphatase [Salinarimonas sp.]
MTLIHICPLADLAKVVSVQRPSHVVSLVSPSMPEIPGGSIGNAQYLRLGINDITIPKEGYVLAQESDVAQLLAFIHGWPRTRPMLMHCWFGVSRSPAAAYIAACALAPGEEEAAIAARLRAQAPFATPNARLVSLADDLLGRKGRMRAAIAKIGRGCEVSTGVPFTLPIGDSR